ncbi:uncharacterized protein JCM6883_002884 [Sporobolomyces salmoneus]|uniref:uncharacterized protein n=1 Tax=Sporobolomyces salmoneus TaxID=183962 RepID=UPI00316B270B
MEYPPPATRLALPSIREFTAWMTVDGKDAPMYGVEQQGNKTICYIESQTNQTFAFNFNVSRPIKEFGGIKRVDLSRVRLYHLRELQSQRRTAIVNGESQRRYCFNVLLPSSRAITGVRTGPATERPFVFCDVPTTSDAQLASADETIFKSLGSVSLQICRYSSKTRVEQPPKHYPNVSGPPVVHEDSKKATLTHAVSFGASQATASKPSWRYKYNWIDRSNRPFHVFEFRYRSRTILELEKFIAPAERPRSLSTSSSPAPPIADDEDDAVSGGGGELARLERELKQLEEQAKLVARKGIKREAGEAVIPLTERSQGSSSGGGGSGSERKKIKMEKGKEEVLVLSDSD